MLHGPLVLVPWSFKAGANGENGRLWAIRKWVLMGERNLDERATVEIEERVNEVYKATAIFNDFEIDFSVVSM